MRREQDDKEFKSDLGYMKLKTKQNKNIHPTIVIFKQKRP